MIFELSDSNIFHPARTGLDEVLHDPARALLQAAGVAHIRPTLAGSFADAAWQSLLGQVITMPLRVGAKGRHRSAEEEGISLAASDWPVKPGHGLRPRT